MATHDYVIANGSGAAVRADLNDALAAIVTGNSNATAPTTTYAYEPWFDTSTSPATIKRRDGSNASWVTIGYADGSIDLGSAATPAIRFNGDTNTGIYSPGADQVSISTGGTQRATVDANGFLLVGHNADILSTPLQVNGTGAQAGFFRYSTSGTASAGIYIVKSASATVGTLAAVSNGDSLGSVIFSAASSSSAVTTSAIIRNTADAAVSANIVPGRLSFFTADTSGTNTEALRINSAQRIGYGSTISAGGVNTTAAFLTGTCTATTNTGSVALETYSGATSTRFHISFGNPNGVVGSISTNASATAYNTSSDYRLKENIVPLTGAVDRILQLKPSRFNFIADPDTQVDGFIAHEAQEVVPECVTGVKDEVDEDGKPAYQGIDQSKLVPLLTAALQEALGKIADLETRLAALEAN
jgi:hypothetical protein